MWCACCSTLPQISEITTQTPTLNHLFLTVRRGLLEYNWLTYHPSRWRGFSSFLYESRRDPGVGARRGGEAGPGAAPARHPAQGLLRGGEYEHAISRSKWGSVCLHIGDIQSGAVVGTEAGLFLGDASRPLCINHARNARSPRKKGVVITNNTILCSKHMTGRGTEVTVISHLYSSMVSKVSSLHQRH